MNFILYNRDDCPFCWKVRLAAAFAGVDFNLIAVARGEQNIEVESLNPGGTIPVMIADSFILWESSLICQYLADEYKSAELLPDDTSRRAQILQVCHYSDQYFGKAIFPYISEMRKQDPKSRDENIIKQSKEKFDYALAWLSSFHSLLGGPDKPNLLDCTLYPRFALAEEYGLDFMHAQEFTNWFSEFKMLEKVQASFC